MAADRIKSLSFCGAIEESWKNDLLALDRESLLAAHKTLAVLRDEIEQALSAIPFDVQPSFERSLQGNIR